MKVICVLFNNIYIYKLMTIVLLLKFDFMYIKFDRQYIWFFQELIRF